MRPPQNLIVEVMNRTSLANEMLPKVREHMGEILRQLGFPGTGGEQTLHLSRVLAADSMEMTQIAFNFIHVYLAQTEGMAAAWNMPVRETQAVLARIGTETAVYLLGKSEELEIKMYAKTSLLHFAVIEMLSLGARTNTYQFAFVNPINFRPELLNGSEEIALVVNVSDDDKLKGALAFGQIEVSKIIPSGIPGMDFLLP